MVNSYENARFWLSLEGYGVETNVRDEKRLVDRCLPAIVDTKEKKEQVIWRWQSGEIVMNMKACAEDVFIYVE